MIRMKTKNNPSSQLVLTAVMCSFKSLIIAQTNLIKGSDAGKHIMIFPSEINWQVGHPLLLLRD